MSWWKPSNKSKDCKSAFKNHKDFIFIEDKRQIPPQVFVFSKKFIDTLKEKNMWPECLKTLKPEIKEEKI